MSCTKTLNALCIAALWACTPTLASAQRYEIRSGMPFQQKTGILMSFALANGHVKTPPFKVKRRPYLVDLIVRTNLSSEDWCCIVNADRNGEGNHPRCSGGPTHQLQASWKLWDGATLVAQGPSNRDLFSTSRCETEGVGTKKFGLGGFQGKRGKMYVLDLQLTNFDRAIPISDAHIFVWPAPDMYP